MSFWATISLLAAAALLVFLECWLEWPRRLTGAQLDLLPALVVYAALTSNVATLATVCIMGGAWLDSLSLNPFGVSIWPLFGVGLAIQMQRDVLLHQRAYTQFILGAAASALVPFGSLLMLWLLGADPLVGWSSLWQWLVLALGGGALTPVIFRAGESIRCYFEPHLPEAGAFRPDREIKRGRT